mgnify:FL=1
MRTSILCEFNKLRRSKILFVALFGIVMILVIVAAQGFYAGGDTVYGMEPEWFLTGVQSLGTMYAIPGIIALFGCYVFCREMQEDTLKSLQIIPIDIPAMLLSKILLVLIFSAALYLILFLSAFIVEAILHVQVLSVGLFGRYLTMYCVEGLSVYCDSPSYLHSYKNRSRLLDGAVNSRNLFVYYYFCWKSWNGFQIVSHNCGIDAFWLL